MTSMRFFLGILVFVVAFYAQGLIQQGQFFWGGVIFFLAGSALFSLITIWRQCKDEETPDIYPENSSIRLDCNPWVLVLALGAWGVSIWFLIKSTSLSDLACMHLGRYDFSYALLGWIGFILFIFASLYRLVFKAWQRFHWKEWIPLGILLLFCLGLGLYRLTSAPPTVHGDEGMVGLQARLILNGKIPSFFSLGWYEIPRFFFFLPALSMAVFGDSLFGLRMSVVLLGTLSLIPFFLLARTWWGTIPAFWGGLLLITNHWFLFLLHSGVNYGQAHFFAITLLCLWYYSNYRCSIGLCLAAGILLGLGLVSYQASQLLPFLWIGSQIWLLIFRQINWKWFTISIALPLVVMGAVFTPWLLYRPAQPGKPSTEIQTEMFTDRADGVLVWTDHNLHHLASVYHTSPRLSQIIGPQLERAFLAPVYFPDRSMQYFCDVPILDRYTALFLLLAFFLGCYQFYDTRWFIPLFWGGSILLVGVAMTIDAPFYPRLAGSTSLYFLLIAGLISSILNFLRDRGVEKKLAIIFFSICTFLTIWFNLNYFYNTYANEKNLRNAHYAQTQLAYYMKTQDPKNFFYLFSGTHFSMGSGTVRFLAKGYRGIDLQQLPPFWKNPPYIIIVDGTKPDFLKEIQARFPDQKPEEHRSPLGNELFYSIQIK